MNATHYATLALLAFASPALAEAPPPTAAMTKATQAAITPAEALQRLKDGNARFVAGKPAERDLLQQVRATANGQFPFASIVSCLDSRTSAELIFDQGLGDVFNARIAGNIVNSDIIGSLEFASKVAGSKVIAVIGHTACGAVKGACDNVELGNLTGLLDKIEPAVKAAECPVGGERTSKCEPFVDNVAEKNVRLGLEQIRAQSPILAELEKKGEVRLVGAMHDISTGKVRFLE